MTTQHRYWEDGRWVEGMPEVEQIPWNDDSGSTWLHESAEAHVHRGLSIQPTFSWLGPIIACVRCKKVAAFSYRSFSHVKNLCWDCSKWVDQ